MRVWKRVLACALTAALIVPSISAAAEEPAGESETVSEIGSENVPESGTEDQKEESGTPAGEEGDVAEGEEGKEESGTPAGEEGDVAEGEEGKEESGTPAEGEGDVTGGEEDKEESGTPAGEEGDVTEGEEDKEESGTPAGGEGDVTEGEDDKEESQTPVEENGSNGLEDKEPVDEEEKQEVDEVQFNTGNHVWSVVNEEAFESGTGDVAFEDDGSYTINLEDNAFFPYEVQFTHDGEVTNEWFMTPDDSVEVGGHTFYVSSYADGTVLTQMTLKVGGDIIVVYPEEKEFTDEETGGIAPMSMLPLTQEFLTVNLEGYTPAELSMVSVDTVFTGDNALEDTEKVVWTYNGKDDYTVSMSGDMLNLSYGTSNTYTYWDMIVGDGDQLTDTNIRYQVTVRVTSSRNWLTPVLYVENSDGTRKEIAVSQYSYNDYYSNDRDRNLYVYGSDELAPYGTTVYAGLSLNGAVFETPGFSSVRVYEGWYSTAEEAMAGKEITSQIWEPDMTEKGAGYAFQYESRKEITMVVFDASNQIMGCLPMNLNVYLESDNFTRTLKKITADKVTYVTDITSRRDQDGCTFYTMTLYKEFAANDTYYLDMDYRTAGITSNSEVTAAYVGRYSTIAEAKAAGAKEIRQDLFESQGYAADYSQGVYITVFVGADGADQKAFQMCFQTVTGENPCDPPSDSAYVTFDGLKDPEGNPIGCHIVDDREDSYGEFNYLTILVDAETDLSRIAPEFYTADGVNLYAAGSSSPEIPGKSVHDFSNGPVQYSAAAEDGRNLRNYWLQIIKPEAGAAKLYINSFADTEAETKTENGVVYSKREVYLDGYHDDIHDILVANVGTEALASLKVELVSDNLDLDSYWTLSGKNGLSGFTGQEIDPDNTGSTHSDTLSNLAKVRLRAKAGVAAGTDVSGTLTIKAGDTTLAVLTLTGTIGDPIITTKEIPEAVKFVPYGTMIQNNNKYSWNRIGYYITAGRLPAGMEMRENGELYGVPREAGSFTFTVVMYSKNYSFDDSRMTYTMVVKENTNANVYNASDAGDGYSLETPIGIEVTPGSYDFYLAEIADTLFVSEGLYNEFIDLWLNGEKLVKGVDYTAESGSTRITISAQTLQNKALQSGANTIAAEFRVDGDMSKELRRTAQNFRLDGAGTDSGSSSSGSSGSGSSGSSDAVRGVTLSGYLVDANNAPMAGMTVELHSTPRTTVTDKNGYFRFADVEFGWHTLFVKDANGNLLSSRRFELREDTVVTLSGDTVTAPAGSGISLTVRVADGELAFSNVRLVAAPRTGDESNLEIWLFVLALVCVALAGTVIYRRKTRHTV